MMKLPYNNYLILLLSTEIYPDVKRGGAIFAKNFYEVLRELVPELTIYSLDHNMVSNSPEMLKLPWRLTSKLRFLIALPVYLFFATNILLKCRPHLVISNGLYECIPPLLVNRPFGVVIHDDSAFRVGVVTRPLIAMVMKRAQFIICPSESTSRIVSYYARRPIFVVNNYIEPRKLRLIQNAKPDALVRRYPQLQGKRIILFVGIFSAHKGVLSLIHSVVELRKRIPDLFLVLVGPGSKEMRLDKAQNGIIHAGVLDEDDLASYLRCASVFVIPSIQSEGFGIALVEAMAAGKPIVAGDLSSFREVAGDGAVYVNGKDVQAIVKALEFLFANESFARSLSEKAKERSRLFRKAVVKEQCTALLYHIAKNNGQ